MRYFNGKWIIISVNLSFFLEFLYPTVIESFLFGWNPQGKLTKVNFKALNPKSPVTTRNVDSEPKSHP